MKAAVRTIYGLPTVLTIQNRPMPIPKENEVLIKVHASTVNRSDCHVLTGKPLVMRLFTGLLKPKLASTGSDFAGEITEAGAKVHSYKVGDRVMGFGGVFGCGAHAQYITVPESTGMVIMPEQWSYPEAAACLEGAVYACGLNRLKPQVGQNALVLGATGAIGSAMVQILASYGVHVTGVCRAKHTHLVRAIGAVKVLDYTREDFVQQQERYDFVLDAVGKYSFEWGKHLMKNKSIFLSSGGGIKHLVMVVYTAFWGTKKVVFSPLPNIKNDLMFIKGLMQTGRFKPVIDQTFPLTKIAAAYNYVMSGQKIGAVVLDLNE